MSKDINEINKERDEDESRNRNIFKTNHYKLNDMKHKIEEGLKENQIWNGYLLNDMISKSEIYLANQYNQIIFLGMKDSGKTTLINSLLGDEVIPYKVNNPKGFEIIIQVRYRDDNLFSVAKCNLQTFQPINEDNNIFCCEDISGIRNQIQQQINLDSNVSLDNNQTNEQSFVKSQSLKIFEIRGKFDYFKNFPDEIRENIFLVDTPGIQVNQHQDKQFFLGLIKNVSQNCSRTIKNYVWVTNLKDLKDNHEKTIIEKVCLQLHLQDRDHYQEYQKQSNLDKQFFLNQQLNNTQGIEQIQLQKENSLKINEQKSVSLNKQDSLMQINPSSNSLMDQIRQVINTSQGLTKQDQQRLSLSFKENSKSSQEETKKKHTVNLFFTELAGVDDYEVIDETQVKIDNMENKWRNEQICFLNSNKVQRQFFVVININNEQNVFKNVEKNKNYKEIHQGLNEQQIKFKNILEKSFKVISVSVLPALITIVYNKYKHDKKKEEEIASSFYQQYKSSFQFKCQKDAINFLRSINFEEDDPDVQIFHEQNLKSNIRQDVNQDSNKKEEVNITQTIKNRFYLKETNLIELESQLIDRVNRLYNYKQQKRRLSIQTIIDKSSNLTRNIFLNQNKKDQIINFIGETLENIKQNHENSIRFQLSQVYDNSLQQRYNQFIQRIEVLYQNHKSYKLFDQIEKELNAAVKQTLFQFVIKKIIYIILILKQSVYLQIQILEYFGESVSSLASSMNTGEELIDENKDQILKEIEAIDLNLVEGIKSIIIDVKKRSLHDANTIMTTKICLSIEQSIFSIGTIIGTSSLFSGLGLAMTRIAGKSILGSGPLGLGVAFGFTLLSTILVVKNREKMLQESKQPIQDYFKKINEEQKNIHEQLIKSYIDVQTEIIKVISDYLQGIASLNQKEYIDEQKILDLQNSNIKCEQNLSQDDDSESDSNKSDSEESEQSEDDSAQCEEDQQLHDKQKQQSMVSTFLQNSQPEYFEQNEDNSQMQSLDENLNNSIFYSCKQDPAE